MDKWLWAARVFKSRNLALEACRGGHVRIGGNAVKAARPVHVGETIVVRTPGLTRTLRVLSLTDRRVGAKLVATLFEDLTPPEEILQARASFAQQVLTRPRGAGRPTKRERRLIEKFLP